MKRLVRLAVFAGIVAAVVAAVKALTREDDPLPVPPAGPTGGAWPKLVETPAAAPAAAPAPGPVAAPAPAPAPEPTTPEPAPVTDRSWVEPTADGECPEGFAIKAKLSSKIFHAPGQLNYDRTTPDRCYASAEAAEADGLRAAKR